MGDYVGDPYPCGKFHHHTINPSAPKICENAHKVTVLVVSVLLSAYSQDHYNDVYGQYVT